MNITRPPYSATIYTNYFHSNIIFNFSSLNSDNVLKYSLVYLAFSPESSIIQHVELNRPSSSYSITSYHLSTVTFSLYERKPTPAILFIQTTLSIQTIFIFQVF